MVNPISPHTDRLHYEEVGLPSLISSHPNRLRLTVPSPMHRMGEAPHRSPVARQLAITTQHTPASYYLRIPRPCRQSLEFVRHEALGKTSDETPDECSRVVSCVRWAEAMNEFVEAAAQAAALGAGKVREE